MTKMNQEIKKEWVEELRHGGREQAFHTTKRGDSYCVMGVLCAIYYKKRGIAMPELMSAIPLEVIKWAGLYSEDPATLMLGDSTFHLTAANDRLRLTFPQLADLIEAQL